MSEKKKKRYPSDRLKLHALLEKREAELQEITEDVEELRRLTLSADHLALNTIADNNNVTPEVFQAFVHARNSNLIPNLETILQTAIEEARRAAEVGKVATEPQAQKEDTDE